MRKDPTRRTVTKPNPVRSALGRVPHGGRKALEQRGKTHASGQAGMKIRIT